MHFPQPSNLDTIFSDHLENERRQKLVALEQQQQRLRRLCEAALDADETHEEYIYSLDEQHSHSATMLEVRADNLQDPNGDLTAPRGGRVSFSKMPLLNAPSNVDDLLTGEVQSFRDKDSVDGASSCGTVDGTIPSPQTGRDSKPVGQYIFGVPPPSRYEGGVLGASVEEGRVDMTAGRTPLNAPSDEEKVCTGGGSLSCINRWKARPPPEYEDTAPPQCREDQTGIVNTPISLFTVPGGSPNGAAYGAHYQRTPLFMPPGPRARPPPPPPLEQPRDVSYSQDFRESLILGARDRHVPLTPPESSGAVRDSAPQRRTRPRLRPPFPLVDASVEAEEGLRASCKTQRQWLQPPGLEGDLGRDPISSTDDLDIDYRTSTRTYGHHHRRIVPPSPDTHLDPRAQDRWSAALSRSSSEKFPLTRLLEQIEKHDAQIRQFPERHHHIPHACSVSSTSFATATAPRRSYVFPLAVESQHHSHPISSQRYCAPPNVSGEDSKSVWERESVSSSMMDAEEKKISAFFHSEEASLGPHKAISGRPSLTIDAILRKQKSMVPFHADPTLTSSRHPYGSVSVTSGKTSTKDRRYTALPVPSRYGNLYSRSSEDTSVPLSYDMVQWRASKDDYTQTLKNATPLPESAEVPQGGSRVSARIRYAPTHAPRRSNGVASRVDPQISLTDIRPQAAFQPPHEEMIHECFDEAEEKKALRRFLQQHVSEDGSPHGDAACCTDGTTIFGLKASSRSPSNAKVAETVQASHTKLGDNASFQRDIKENGVEAPGTNVGPSSASVGTHDGFGPSVPLLQAKAEELARLLVRTVKEKKMLQESVEQLEGLVEESNFEVGRLQHIVEQQQEQFVASTGVQSALTAKEREIAICEEEIKRLNNTIESFVHRLSDTHDSAHPPRDGLVTRTADLDSALADVGVAYLAQREAEDRAAQLTSELNAAVEQIQELDSRLAEMERCAAAERLREVRRQLLPDEHLDVEGTRGLPPIPTQAEVQHWPLEARRTLARLVSHAEGLALQNAESARHAALRVQHLEHECGELRRKDMEHHEERSLTIQDNTQLRRTENALRRCGEQWHNQLQEVKEHANIVSELVNTSLADAEDIIISCAATNTQLDSATDVREIAALAQQKNSKAKHFAQQISRDLHCVARFLAALRSMDIGEVDGYQVLLRLADGSPSGNVVTAGGSGRMSPVHSLTADQTASRALMQKKRDFVIRALETAMQDLSEPLTSGHATGKLPASGAVNQSHQLPGCCEFLQDGFSQQSESERAPATRTAVASVTNTSHTGQVKGFLRQSSRERTDGAMMEQFAEADSFEDVAPYDPERMDNTDKRFPDVTLSQRFGDRGVSVASGRSSRPSSHASSKEKNVNEPSEMDKIFSRGVSHAAGESLGNPGHPSSVVHDSPTHFFQPPVRVPELLEPSVSVTRDDRGTPSATRMAYSEVSSPALRNGGGSDASPALRPISSTYRDVIALPDDLRASPENVDDYAPPSLPRAPFQNILVPPSCASGGNWDPYMSSEGRHTLAAEEGNQTRHGVCTGNPTDSPWAPVEGEMHEGRETIQSEEVPLLDANILLPLRHGESTPPPVSAEYSVQMQDGGAFDKWKRNSTAFSSATEPAATGKLSAVSLTASEEADGSVDHVKAVSGRRSDHGEAFLDRDAQSPHLSAQGVPLMRPPLHPNSRAQAQMSSIQDTSLPGAVSETKANVLSCPDSSRKVPGTNPHSRGQGSVEEEDNEPCLSFSSYAPQKVGLSASNSCDTATAPAFQVATSVGFSEGLSLHTATLADTAATSGSGMVSSSRLLPGTRSSTCRQNVDPPYFLSKVNHTPFQLQADAHPSLSELSTGAPLPRLQRSAAPSPIVSNDTSVGSGTSGPMPPVLMRATLPQPRGTSNAASQRSPVDGGATSLPSTLRRTLTASVTQPGQEPSTGSAEGAADARASPLQVGVPSSLSNTLAPTPQVRRAQLRSVEDGGGGGLGLPPPFNGAPALSVGVTPCADPLPCSPQPMSCRDGLGATRPRGPRGGDSLGQEPGAGSVVGLSVKTPHVNEYDDEKGNAVRAGGDTRVSEKRKSSPDKVPAPREGADQSILLSGSDARSPQFTPVMPECNLPVQANTRIELSESNSRSTSHRSPDSVAQRSSPQATGLDRTAPGSPTPLGDAAPRQDRRSTTPKDACRLPSTGSCDEHRASSISSNASTQRSRGSKSYSKTPESSEKRKADISQILERVRSEKK